MLISKEQVIQGSQLPFEDVPVPELAPDGEARIRTMTGLEKDEWEASVYIAEEDGKTKKIKTRVNQVNWRANLLARCWVGEDGKRLFSTAEDILALGGLSAIVIDRMYAVAKRLNAIGSDEEEAVEKN